MQPWLVRGCVMAVVYGAAETVLAKVQVDHPGSGSVVDPVLLALLVGVSGLWAGLDGWHRRPRRGMTWFYAALIGGVIGFLWFNAFPAELFMGDTGALALGGALAAMAIMLKVEFLLLFVGGIFVVVALSVMLQVLSFKWFGRRIFLIAPLQHHFEMKAWSETKIMVRFWIVTAILCAAGFALFYKYYPNIRPN